MTVRDDSSSRITSPSLGRHYMPAERPNIFDWLLIPFGTISTAPVPISTALSTIGCPGVVLCSLPPVDVPCSPTATPHVLVRSLRRYPLAWISFW